MHLPNVLKRWRVTIPAVALTAAGLTVGVQNLDSQGRQAPAPRATTASTPSAAPAASAPLNTASYADAVAKALPAVVTVRVEKREDRQPLPQEIPEPFRRFFGPQMPDEEGQGPLRSGLGSGVLVASDGTILTNNHVVEGAERVTVVLSDGREYTAKVVGTDAPTDLAVLDIEGNNLPTLPFVDSNRIRVGDVVLAVGNPLGIGQTVTMGIISAKGRSGLGEGYEDFLQTDAPINRGNSGGALITTSGELVGINSQIVSPSGGNIGIGFAIPVNLAKNVMNQLVTTGKVRRGMLGVYVQRLSSDLARGLGLGNVQGALVSSVDPNGPASKAGLTQGDVILRVNGSSVSDSNDLRNRISSITPGERVTLDVFKDGKERSVQVTLAEVPATERAADEAPAERQEFGMGLQRLTPDLANRLQLEGNPTGVVVVTVEPGSAAARAGVQPRDIIRKIDGRDVNTPAEVRDALNRTRTAPAVVVVEREGRSTFLAIP